MAARVFKIDELATYIATHLLAISPESTVALALTCRALEGPVLKLLWEMEDSLQLLIIRVLAMEAFYFSLPDRAGLYLLVSFLFSSSRHLSYSTVMKNQQALRRPLTTWELNRLKRYASWMRRLQVREWGLSEELTRFVLPTPTGDPPVLRLHLRELDWWLNETNLSFLLEFLSPHLTKIIITASNFIRPGEAIEPWDGLPDKVVPEMRSAIKLFPLSLQILDIHLGSGLQTYITEEISAFILGCGDSFRELNTNSALSTQAIVHLMKLPNLCAWVTEQGPPQVTDLIRCGIPDDVVSIFPSLKTLGLRSEPALEWFTLFEAAKNRTSPWVMAGNSLSAISYHHPTLPVDSSLVSRFLQFANLVDITIETGCSLLSCKSQFTDQDVERLALALPKLEVLVLGGWPCGADTCLTTVHSLLSLSACCTELKHLAIHFCVANLQADILDMFDYAYSQGLHSSPKCALEELVTGEMRFEPAHHDPRLISLGMLMIFPSLARYITSSPTWAPLDAMVKGLGQIKEIAAVTENLMRYLNEERESVNNGVPARSTVGSPHLSW